MEPYHLYLATVQLPKTEIVIGELLRIPIYMKFEKIWAVKLYIDPPEAEKYIHLLPKPLDDSVLVLSCWNSEERPYEKIKVSCDVTGVLFRNWDGLITEPFWKYLLQESIYHIDRQDYHVAILLAAMAFESFL